MLNFTVGPVMSTESVRLVGAKQTPYFRNEEFSKVMFENEMLMKKFAHASDDSRVIFITGSGTASMEAIVMNVYTKNDKVLVVNGGGFGQRFVDLCKLHEIPYEEINPNWGEDIAEETLNQYSNKGFTSFLVNICETSSGVLYDLNLISAFCKKNGLLLVVDAISSFLADPISMIEQNIDVLLTGSQKALACPPGVSIIVLNKKALERVESNTSKSMYLDLKNALKNGERGQTPFTPAVTTLLQINTRLNEIKSQGGVESEINKVSTLANDFRERIKNLPLKIKCKHMGNAVTAVYCSSPHIIVDTLKNEYSIWVNPSGGEIGEKMFRVGHIGDLTLEDNTKLIQALHDLENRGILK